MSDNYKDYDLNMADMDFIENMTDEQLEQACEAARKALDTIVEALNKVTDALVEAIQNIDWNSIREAVQEAQNNYEGDNNNSDNLCNIGDDLMDQ